ncbi:c-type cytochrome biogenesis protein CcmI, partial [Rhizobiales bacterium L72]|nr:c-type cytochrome biogenesis protein CcmI [Propylenella binzhouense]
MLFWILLTILTGAAVLAVLVPLGRVPKAGPEGRAHDAAVYRDQLQELERERAAGLIGTEEAESARAEIARRLLAAEAAQAPPAAGGRAERRRA